MLDVALHTGAEHPNLGLILVPSLLAFVAGLGLGASADRVREWLADATDSAAN